MTEKVLAYDRAIVPQETGFWCGPASAQVTLNALGINVAESTLAREIGTTVNGTDYIGLIERILDLRVPQHRYTSVYIDNDPPTPSQRERLWNHTVSSILAGCPVVMNWVAPPGNHPIGIKGSSTPRYSGTIYHYVTAVGFDDRQGGRAFKIADSGFAPYEYWVSLEQCATLIPPKGYCYADTKAHPPAAPDNPAADLLLRVMGGSAPYARYEALLPGVQRSLQLCDADSVNRIAMWCAQVGHESGGLRYQTEIADGSAYEGRTDLGNVKPGDGKRFRGRDFIQITGRHNYAALSRWAFENKLVPTSTFFVDDPEALAADKYAFLGTTWYWTTQRQMNDAADAGDLDRATRYINGGLNGIDDRRRRYNVALSFGTRLLTLAGASDITDEWDDLMASDELIESVSIYAAPGEGPRYTARQLLRSCDARLHEQFVETRARRGDPDALRRIALVAAGRGKYTDEATVNDAIVLLADLTDTSPDELKNRLQNGPSA